MTLEEKIEHLRIATMEEARADGNKIISTHKSSIDQIFEDHKDIALRQAELSLKTERNNAKQNRNKAVSKALIELKREQGRCQTQLKTQLFSDVRQLIDDFMATPAYAELLLKYIEQAKAFAKDEPLLIYLSANDASKQAYLEEHSGATLTVSKDDFIGGTRALLEGSNVLIDRSFASAINDEYENFFFSGGVDNE